MKRHLALSRRHRAKHRLIGALHLTAGCFAVLAVAASPARAGDTKLTGVEVVTFDFPIDYPDVPAINTDLSGLTWIREQDDGRHLYYAISDKANNSVVPLVDDLAEDGPASLRLQKLDEFLQPVGQYAYDIASYPGEDEGFAPPDEESENNVYELMALPTAAAGTVMRSMRSG